MKASPMISLLHCFERRHRSRGQHGFTLIELMVVLAVFTALVTIAMPSFSALVMNNRLATTTSEVQNALVYARSEAVTRRQPVSVCPSVNGTTCTGNSNWTAGLIVFTDKGTAGTLDDTDQILKYIQSTGTLTITPAGSLDTAAFIRFTATGTAAINGNGMLTFCDTRTGPYGRQLRLSQIGRTEATRQVVCPS